MMVQTVKDPDLVNLVMDTVTWLDNKRYGKLIWINETGVPPIGVIFDDGNRYGWLTALIVSGMRTRRVEKTRTVVVTVVRGSDFEMLKQRMKRGVGPHTICRPDVVGLAEAFNELLLAVSEDYRHNQQGSGWDLFSLSRLRAYGYRLAASLSCGPWHLVDPPDTYEPLYVELSRSDGATLRLWPSCYPAEGRLVVKGVWPKNEEGKYVYPEGGNSIGFYLEGAMVSITIFARTCYDVGRYISNRLLTRRDHIRGYLARYAEAVEKCDRRNLVIRAKARGLSDLLVAFGERARLEPDEEEGVCLLVRPLTEGGEEVCVTGDLEGHLRIRTGKLGAEVTVATVGLLCGPPVKDGS